MTDPQHIVDQAEAATNEIVGALKNLAGELEVGIEERHLENDESMISNLIRTRLMEPLESGTFHGKRMCRHVRRMKAPAPLGLPLWDMDRVYCDDCVVQLSHIHHDLLGHGDECDICGASGLPEEALVVVMAQVAFILVCGQACLACVYSKEVPK